MDETAYDGGSAFALTHEEWNTDRNEYEIVTHGGMSLRDWFAGTALQGMCAASDEAGTLVQHGYEWLAKESYAIADAMLRARREKP